MLHAEQHAEHVGVEGSGVTLGGLLGDRPGLAFGAGIVDGDIEAAEAGDGLVDQVPHVVLVAHIGANEFRLRAERAEFGDQRLAGVVAAAGDDDAGAFAGKGQGGGAADAGQGAGDQDNGIAHVISPCKSGRSGYEPRNMAAWRTNSSGY